MRYDAAPKCTCGVTFSTHKSGRCADAMLHRLLYDEQAEEYTAGTQYFDGLRDTALFEDDYLFERDGEFHLLPKYTGNKHDVWTLFSKWNDTGGTGRLHMNTSGWSGSFSHQILRSGAYYTGNMQRTRLEWLPIRVLARRACEVRIASGVDTCEWIDGIEPPDPS